MVFRIRGNIRCAEVIDYRIDIMHEISWSTPYLDPTKKLLIELRNVDFDYPDGRRALRDVSLLLYEGDRLAVVGRNGAGKTTLAKLIAGIYKPTSGKVTVNDSLKIGMVFQDCDDQLFCPTVYEDIAFGLLLKGFSQEKVEEKVRKWAKRLEVEKHLSKEPHNLSYGERKRVAFAAVLALDPDILILDEPTLGLDQKSEGIILDILNEFRGTIICISHDLFFLYFSCRRALVLKDGSVHHDYTMDDLVSHKGTLREHGLDFTFRFECCINSETKNRLNERKIPSNSGSHLLELRNYSYRYPDGTLALRDVSLAIDKGDRVAILGENGAGKSTLALCLVGVLKGNGLYRLNGIEVSEKVRKTLWQQIGIVFQDARDQLFTSSCFEEIAFGLRRLGLSEREITSRVLRVLDMVRLNGYENRVTGRLSGGEQKRLALAAVLAMNPDILILDEPTNNLDPEGEKILIEILSSLKTTLIIISHDVCFLSFLCNRAIILDKGQLKSDTTFEDFLALEASLVRHHHEHDYRARCCHVIRELFYSD